MSYYKGKMETAHDAVLYMVGWADLWLDFIRSDTDGDGTDHLTHDPFREAIDALRAAQSIAHAIQEHEREKAIPTPAQTGVT